MAYTVKQVAAISGVSVRTLHFYDEAGLLKPAYHGANGYRYYEEPQLLNLQQILFYRELGFVLKEIKRILNRKDFEKIAALESHRKVLRKDLARTRKLIETIDKTIEHLKGKTEMKSEELFVGFDAEQQAKYERQLIDRFGERMKEGIAESKARVKAWKKADWEKAGLAFNAICQDLAAAMQHGLPPESPDVQKVIRRHYQWLKQFWTPNRERYIGHGQIMVCGALRQAYEAHHPELPEFTATAMKVFAEAELS